jgi:hypothetical protein
VIVPDVVTGDEPTVRVELVDDNPTEETEAFVKFGVVVPTTEPFALVVRKEFVIPVTAKLVVVAAVVVSVGMFAFTIYDVEFVGSNQNFEDVVAAPSSDVIIVA